MSALRQAAEDLLAALEEKALDARCSAAKHSGAEVLALQNDDEASAVEHQALGVVARGKALAYEDASERVRLFVAGIPEGM